MKKIKTMKTWETQNGDFIPYNKLEDSHLLNILKWIEHRAETGVVLQYGGGIDLEDLWYEEHHIEGEDVLKHYDYKGLLQEAKKRKLKCKAKYSV